MLWFFNMQRLFQTRVAHSEKGVVCVDDKIPAFHPQGSALDILLYQDLNLCVTFVSA